MNSLTATIKAFPSHCKHASRNILKAPRAYFHPNIPHKRFQITRGHVILVFVNPSTTIAGRITRLRMNRTVYEHYSIVV